jgi:hypothetical protein
MYVFVSLCTSARSLVYFVLDFYLLSLCLFYAYYA